MSKGFLLGKFMPPHAGHLFLCDVARARVDELTVLLCSHDAEPISGELRVRWMGECLAGTGIRLCHMHRNIPQTPEEHRNFWTIWKAAIAEYHPDPIDWVFASEPYVVPLAACLGASPFLVDQKRLAVPVSAQVIRTNPADHWSHVPPPVRPYFQKRVTILGPESSGKSVLSEKLAMRFATLAVPEYGRDYDAAFRNGRGWSAMDFVNIADGQAALRAAISRRAAPVLMEDTDLLQTLVWAEYLLGKIPSALRGRLETYELASHYLLLGADVAWVDDGTRYSGDQTVREWFCNRLLYWLNQVGAKWTCVEGKSMELRERQAEYAVLQLSATDAKTD